jgi:hypothetical protein
MQKLRKKDIYAQQLTTKICTLPRGILFKFGSILLSSHESFIISILMATFEFCSQIKLTDFKNLKQNYSKDLDFSFL